MIISSVLIHIFVDGMGTRVLNKKMSCVPRVGDEVRLSDALVGGGLPRFLKAIRVVRPLDEDEERANIELGDIDDKD